MLQFFSSVNDMTLSFTVAKMVANCLAYMNSCVNPILYAFLSDNFRKAFFRLMSCCAGAGTGTGGFSQLRKIEMEQTNITAGRRVSAATVTAAAAGRKIQLDNDDIAQTTAMMQQTDL